MNLKFGIQQKILAHTAVVARRHKHITPIVTPVDAQGCGEGYEEVFKAYGRTRSLGKSEFATLCWPGKMVDPGTVGNFLLLFGGVEIHWEAVEASLARANEPAHGEEHGVDDCDLLRRLREVGKFTKNVYEEFTQWMTIAETFRVLILVSEGAEIGIGWSKDLVGGYAFFEFDAPGEEKVA